MFFTLVQNAFKGQMFGARIVRENTNVRRHSTVIAFAEVEIAIV